MNHEQRKTELVRWAKEVQLPPEGHEPIRGLVGKRQFGVCVAENAGAAPGERYAVSAARVSVLEGRDNPLLILIGDGAYPEHLLSLVRLDRRSGDPRAKGRRPRARGDTPSTPRPGNARTSKATPPGTSKATPPGTAKGTSKATPRATAKGTSKATPRGNRATGAAALAGVDLRGITVRYVPVGHSRDNIGIVAFNARRYVRNKLSFEIFMEVVNYRKRAAAVDLQLYSDGQLIEVQRLKLGPGETARYSCDPDRRGDKSQAWCDLAATGQMLEARLVPPGATGEQKPAAVDAFPVDDRAFALLPHRDRQKVLLVTTGNLFLEGALLQQPNIDVDRVAPGGYSTALARRFDAVIFDATYPADPPPGHAMIFNPPPEGGPFTVRGRVDAPLITDQDHKHPVMRWVTLKDVNIASSAQFAAGPGVQVLASSFKKPLMVARSDGQRKTVAFGFDLSRSDLPLRVAFPILILNALDWFAGDSEALLTSHRTGETWAVELRHAPTRPASGVQVVRPDGTRVTAPVHEGRALVHGVQAGIYEILGRGQATQIAANLADPTESRIQPRRRLVMGGRTLSPPTGFGIALRREIWIYLLLVALALTLLEWLTYNRRFTV